MLVSVSSGVCLGVDLEVTDGRVHSFSSDGEVSEFAAYFFELRAQFIYNHLLQIFLENIDHRQYPEIVK